MQTLRPDSITSDLGDYTAATIVPMSITGGPLALSDDDDNSYASANDVTDGSGTLDDNGFFGAALYTVKVHFAASGVHFMRYKVRIRALAYQKPSVFYGDVVDEANTTAVGDDGSFTVPVGLEELADWYESDWRNCYDSVDVTSGPLLMFLRWQSALDLPVPGGPVIDLYELRFDFEEDLNYVYTVRRNLAINPSGEQSFNLAWGAINGKVGSMTF